MKFYPIDEFKTMSEDIIGSLSSADEAIITEGGKPAAVLMKISNDNFDDLMQSIRQARLMITINSMRQKTAERGYMTDEEIDAEIAAVRRGE